MADVRERLQHTGTLLPPPEDPFERLLRRRDRRRSRERLMAGFVAVALAGGVVGLTLMALGRTGRGSVRTPWGTVSGHGQLGTLDPGPGQLLYIKETIVVPQGQAITQTWWKADGSGRREFDCTIGSDCMFPVGDGALMGWGVGRTGTFGPRAFPVDSDLSGLSTDPSVLSQQLLDRTAPSGNSPEPDQISPGPELASGVSAGSLWRAITEILKDPNATPDLRAAVFEVARTVPGVEVVDHTTDPLGRPAMALRFPYDGGTVAEYDFDPSTLQVMAISGGLESYGQGAYTVYEMGIADTTDQPPGDGQWLTPPYADPLPSPTA